MSNKTKVKQTKLGTAITLYLQFIENYVGGEASEGRTDLAKKCENIVKNILNKVYGYDVINLNDQKANFPSVDLLDKENGTVYQVTAASTENINKKIKETLEKYKKNKVSEKIKEEYGVDVRSLKIIRLKYDISKEPYKKQADTPSIPEFSAKDGVMGLEDIFKDAMTKEKGKELLAYLEREYSAAIKAFAGGVSWKEIPAFSISGNNVDISTIELEFDMDCHYGGTVSFFGDRTEYGHPIYCLTMQITNSSDVPITNIEFKDFFMGCIDHIEMEEFEMVPVTHETDNSASSKNIIYPDKTAEIRILFYDDEYSEEEPYTNMLYFSLNVTTSSIHSGRKSEQNHRVVCRLDGEKNKYEPLSGTYELLDVSSTVVYL